MALFDYDPPERFVAGTVGPPGGRTFFLQARRGQAVTSVSLEKVQVAVLAERIEELLETVEAGPAGYVPTDIDPLETPIEDEFRVVALSLSWDDERARLIIACHDHDPDEESPDPVQDVVAGRSTLRVVLTPVQAQSFATRAASVVAAGRPPCPFCGGPLDADGHICPRANGYRR